MEEKQNYWKELKTFRQKAEYFWDYHKWKVIIPIVVLIFAISFISSYLEETAERALAVAIVDARDSEAVEKLIKEDYADARGIDTQKTPIRIESGMVYPKVMDERAAADTVTVASIQKYSAMLINGTIDINISPTWVVEEYGKADAYRNLKELLPEKVYHSIEDKLFWCKDATGTEIPAGIYVDDKAVLGEFYDDGVPILTVSAYSGRVEEAVAFIEWFIEQ